MSFCFVLNPVAGKGRAKVLVPVIERICRDNNVEFQIKTTSKPGEGTEIARWAVENGFKRIISVGGDGTINELINGIAGHDIALGIIPGGSGNDFIRSINKSRDIERIITDVIKGEARKVDLGICNNKYFVNIASVGLDAEVAGRMEKAKKFFTGSAAYIAAMLYTIFTYKGWNMKIEVDGKSFEAKTLLTAIANGKYYGGGMIPAPEARIDDGYFEVCHVGHMSKLKMLTLFPKYMKGRHAGIKEVSFYRGEKVKISCDIPMAINLDGEVIVDREVEFRIIKNGINIIFPEEQTNKLEL